MVMKYKRVHLIENLGKRFCRCCLQDIVCVCVHVCLCTMRMFVCGVWCVSMCVCVRYGYECGAAYMEEKCPQ